MQGPRDAIDAIGVRKPLRVADHAISLEDILIVGVFISLLVGRSRRDAVDGVLYNLILRFPDETQHRVHEDADHEAVEPVEGVQVFCAHGGLGVVVDAVGQSREVGAHCKEESDHGTPVDAALVVPVSSTRVVQSGDIDVLSLDDPVVGGDDACHRSQEDGIAAHKCEECGGRVEDLPRNNDPSADDGGNDASTLDVDVSREQHSQIVCCLLDQYD